MVKRLEPILPGSYLGILGGGQLGRMFTQAAQAMGYKVCVLDPSADSPAGSIAEQFIQADYIDSAALKKMANLCKSVSTEFENVPAQALDELEALGVFVAPRSNCVSIAQDRVAEKKFLSTWKQETNIGPAPYCVIEHDADIALISADLFPGILKTARMGYDGKGQITVHESSALVAAWAELGKVPCVLEKRMELDFEVSALVVRGYDDEVVAYPVSQNIHRDGILFTSTVPAPSLKLGQEKKMIEAAKALIRKIDYVGVLCVEFFVLKNGDVVVNEIAPRPHNSGHYTMNACVTSQFEQQVRSMARLPLGDTRLLAPVSMLNLLGDLWFDGDVDKVIEPAWNKVLAHPDTKLHLYGKSDPRMGRKMGHINCLGESLNQARQNCAAVAAELGIEP
ncbi:N5-carboxyaminoimidazole ribonucleotide synthase [Polynucleobacter sp. TUM22923]|jgi:5-(carboxyamino)imidazole ribonucleotide synthase|uniref:5-(carboxyamino)imidazole ribonucleotide synthase n=1 Tax=Polynucleobacter sp. TUM22923 TaxID=3022126 RepID=UPI00257343B6|nr:5-(carboxyamino)imidazole ribonucleotide synthase [Polynucleobacter sp. TUM22923]BDX22221.1 N5-carboxyaminoimidazole ribonucleotide synthase [Polynucleobacter sp. TUM22923]